MKTVMPEDRDGAIERFIQRRREEGPLRVEKHALPAEEARKIQMRAALGIGAGAGLAFGLTSQVFSHLAVADLAVFQPPLGWVGNLALFTGLGVLLCLAVAWKEKAQGYLLAGLSLALLGYLAWRTIEIGAGISLGGRLWEFLHGSVFTLGALFMMLILAFPYMLLLRLAIDVQVEHCERPWWSPRRLGLPLAALLAAGLVGLLYMHSPEERRAVRDLDALLRQAQVSAAASGVALPGQAQAAATDAGIPLPLREMGGTPYAQGAGGSYVLLTDRAMQGSSMVPPRFKNSKDTLAGARFANGYALVCRFTWKDAVVCASSQ